MLYPTNPHLARLKAHSAWHKLDPLFNPDNIVLWVMLMVGGLCFAMADAYYLGTVRFWILVARVFVVIFAPIPWLMAAAASYHIRADVQSNRLDLLRMTPLHERRLFWGYIGATLFRFRYVIRIAVGSMVVTFGGMTLAGLGSDFHYVAADYVVMWAAYIAHFVGSCLAIVVMVGMVAVRVSYGKGLGIGLPLVASTAILLNLTLSLQVVESRLIQPIDMPLAFRDGLLLVAPPYLVLAGSWIVALRWIRQD